LANNVINILGYEISLSLPNKIDGSICVISTLNPHSFCVAQKDEIFRTSLVESDILIPDGVGFVFASKFLKGNRIKKISGFDLHTHYLKLLADTGGGKVFYLGASEKTLELIINRLEKEFRTINVKTYSPPYKSSFSHYENCHMLKLINEFEPDILFVGMTAPKQEKWVYQNKGKLKAKVVCSVGAVFDFYAGTVKRPSKFWIGLGLEWFPRLLKEPKRLWRRNLISTPKFIFEVIRHKLTL